MKRIYVYFLALIATIGLVAVPYQATVLAANPEPDQLTESQIKEIATNCSNVATRIQQVQRIDRATRLNQGGLYTAIQDLMATLNGRAVLNQKDATKTLAIAGRLSVKFEEYRANYQKYDQALTSLIQFQDCNLQPTVFYANLTQLRGMRTQLANDVAQMGGLMSEFRQGVVEMQAATKGQP